MDNSRRRKQIPFGGLESYLFISWTKKDMILKPTTGRELKLVSPCRRAYCAHCVTIVA